MSNNQGAFPFHDEFQDLVAAYLWRHNGAFQAHEAHFKPSYISVSTTATLVNMLADHWKKYRQIPTEAALRECIRVTHPGLNDESDTRKRAALEIKLEKLKNMPLTDHQFIDEKIREFARFVAVKNFIMLAKDDLLEQKYDPDLPNKCREALSIGATSFDIGHKWRDQTDDRIERITNTEIDPRIPTGLPHLDAQINGGLQAGELGILLALPKHFKSGTMLNFGYSAMRQSVAMNVAYITLELSEDLVGMRYDLRCSLMTKEQMQQNPHEFKRILKERQEIIMGENELFIKAFKTKTCSCDTIRTYLDRLYAELDIKIGLMVVDYLDLMKSSRPRDKDYLEAVDICEDLRSLASKQEYNMPIWTACRATREAVGRRKISMNHMSKAFERIGVADLVLALCQTEQEKAERKMRVVPVAARNDSGDKVVDCKIDYERMSLTSVGLSDPEYDDGTDDDEDGSKKYKKKGKKTDDKPKQLEEPPYQANSY
jgi:hypothetical protein